MYTKNINILQLLLNIVTAKIEARAVLGNKILYACVKEGCEHSHTVCCEILKEELCGATKGVGVVLAADSQSTSKSGYRASLWDP
jgi:hypothetical protein